MNSTVEGIQSDIDCVQWCARKSGVALAMPPDFKNLNRLDQATGINKAWNTLIMIGFNT